MKIAHVAEEKNPVVLGRLGREAGRPTVLFYGHYDVQPAMERDWRTDPFELNSVDGYLYGRGTSDNKVRASVMPSDRRADQAIGKIDRGADQKYR